MRVWHCLLIIVITISLFIFGMFRKDIEGNLDYSKYEQQEADKNRTENLNSKDQKINAEGQHSQTEQHLGTITRSKTWAEFESRLTVPEKNKWVLHSFSKIIESKRFRNLLSENLSEKITVMEQIFSPFENSFFLENKSEILATLFSTRIVNEKEDSFVIICRGHSMHCAKLLAKVLFETLDFAIKNERYSNPLLNHLNSHFLTIQELQEKVDHVKIKLHAKVKDDNHNIESIALQSELLQLEEECKVMKSNLKKIDELYKKSGETLQFLSIDYIYNHGRVLEYKKIIEDLEMLKSNRELDEFMSTEIEKNITANSRLLETEIITAIDHLKSMAKITVERRFELQKRIVDINKDKAENLHNHSDFKLLNELNTALQQKRNDYHLLYSKWDLVKNDYTINY
tara:strand:- start:801 stop:2000 length:1200 start_codon:yes stop_codon:yes gene_type:complete